MKNGLKIMVFFSSYTVGGHKGREGMFPVCHVCEKALGVKKNNSKLSVMVPPEAMPLIFSAELAAEELGVNLELIDVNQLPITKRLKIKLRGEQTPYIQVGRARMLGLPTKDEIIALYHDQ
jgi:hypothetical protein